LSEHETYAAKAGRDAVSVIDGKLKVYGLNNLRIADGFIMPRETTGNTMAPCIIIGERSAVVLRVEHIKIPLLVHPATGRCATLADSTIGLFSTFLELNHFFACCKRFNRKGGSDPARLRTL
jgi:hypothetical protein